MGGFATKRPFLSDVGLPATLRAVIVLVTTTILGLLVSIFQKSITPAA